MKFIEVVCTKLIGIHVVTSMRRELIKDVWWRK